MGLWCLNLVPFIKIEIVLFDQVPILFFIKHEYCGAMPKWKQSENLKMLLQQSHCHHIVWKRLEAGQVRESIMIEKGECLWCDKLRSHGRRKLKLSELEKRHLFGWFVEHDHLSISGPGFKSHKQNSKASSYWPNTDCESILRRKHLGCWVWLQLNVYVKENT